MQLKYTKMKNDLLALSHIVEPGKTRGSEVDEMIAEMDKWFVDAKKFSCRPPESAKLWSKTCDRPHVEPMFQTKDSPFPLYIEFDGGKYSTVYIQHGTQIALGNDLGDGNLMWMTATLRFFQKRKQDHVTVEWRMVVGNMSEQPNVKWLGTWMEEGMYKILGAYRHVQTAGRFKYLEDDDGVEYANMIAD